MMRMKLWFFAVMVLSMGLTAVPSNAATYDVMADFSNIQGGANGVWSYGWTYGSSLGNPIGFTLSEFSDLFPSDFHDGAWWGSGYANIWKNTSDQTWNNAVDPGEVSMHPGSIQEYAVIRWTSPFDGQIDIHGWFGAGDTGAEGYYIYKGTESLFAIGSTYGDGVFEHLTTTVQFGDTLDFVVGNFASAGNTPLHATITEIAPVPLPASILLLGPGLAGLAVFRKRFLK